MTKDSGLTLIILLSQIDGPLQQLSKTRKPILHTSKSILLHQFWRLGSFLLHRHRYKLDGDRVIKYPLALRVLLADPIPIGKTQSCFDVAKNVGSDLDEKFDLEFRELI